MFFLSRLDKISVPFTALILGEYGAVSSFNYASNSICNPVELGGGLWAYFFFSKKKIQMVSMFHSSKYFMVLEKI